MQKKDVYKPKNNIYKEIIQLTQSVLYTPKPERWFLENFAGVKAEKVKEALLFLCHTGYLYRLEDESYAVGFDFRLKIRGIYHSDGKNGHIHPDNIRKIYNTIFVPKKWSLGAQHNDRIEVAVEGELFDFTEPAVGTVHSIVEPAGDFFVGRQHRVNGKWVVFPEDKALGNCIPVEGTPIVLRSGVLVFARLNHARIIRSNCKLTADIRQKKQTICWNEICGGDESEYQKEEVYKFCTIIKNIKSEEERLLYKYGLFPEMSEQAKIEFLAETKRPGKPIKRLDITDVPAMLLSEKLAVHIEEVEDIMSIMVHVPDLLEWFLPESESEAELLKRCMGDDFLPLKLKEKTKFSDGHVQNAFTVSFKTDKNGEVFEPEIIRTKIFTEKKENPLYKSLIGSVQIEGLSSNPLICAADDAAAMWFDQNDVPAPFTHVRFCEEAESLIAVAKQLGWCENYDATLENVHMILKTAKKNERLEDAINLVNEMTDVQTEAFGEDNMTVLFCNPFENYLSLLTQYCFVQAKRLRTSAQKTEHLNFVFERVAMYNYRLQQFKYYRCAHSNLQLSKKLKKGEKYEGYFITHTENKKVLFFVNGSFGIVNTDVKFKAGEKALLCFEDISLDCLDLLYKLS